MHVRHWKVASTAMNAAFIPVFINPIYQRNGVTFLQNIHKIQKGSEGGVQHSESPDSGLCSSYLEFWMMDKVQNSVMYEARPQSKFPTRPTASKPYIARSDCAYVIEQ
jgi:hypothetical protein